MSGWQNRSTAAERIAATRIPDEMACPGGGRERVRIRGAMCCPVCLCINGGHYPDGRAQKHKRAPWMQE